MDTATLIDLRNFLEQYTPEELVRLANELVIHYSPETTDWQLADKISQVLYLEGYQVTPQGLTNIPQTQPPPYPDLTRSQSTQLPSSHFVQPAPLLVWPFLPRPASQPAQLYARPRQQF